MLLLITTTIFNLTTALCLGLFSHEPYYVKPGMIYKRISENTTFYEYETKNLNFSLHEIINITNNILTFIESNINVKNETVYKRISETDINDYLNPLTKMILRIMINEKNILDNPTINAVKEEVFYIIRILSQTYRNNKFNPNIFYDENYHIIFCSLTKISGFLSFIKKKEKEKEKQIKIYVTLIIPKKLAQQQKISIYKLIPIFTLNNCSSNIQNGLRVELYSTFEYFIIYNNNDDNNKIMSYSLLYHLCSKIDFEVYCPLNSKIRQLNDNKDCELAALISSSHQPPTICNYILRNSFSLQIIYLNQHVLFYSSQKYAKLENNNKSFIKGMGFFYDHNDNISLIHFPCYENKDNNIVIIGKWEGKLGVTIIIMISIYTIVALICLIIMFFIICKNKISYNNNKKPSSTKKIISNPYAIVPIIPLKEEVKNDDDDNDYYQTPRHPPRPVFYC